MSVCDCCDGPATIRHSLVLFTGTNTFASWDLSLCEKCAKGLPGDISQFLGKAQTK